MIQRLFMRERTMRYPIQVDPSAIKFVRDVPIVPKPVPDPAMVKGAKTIQKLWECHLVRKITKCF